MDKRNKLIGKLLAALIIFGVLAGSGRTVLPVDAAQDAQTAQETENADDSASYGSGTVMKAEKETAMKAEPETSAETLMTFEKGSLIFVLGETAEGWYHVRYQSMEGYVEKEGMSVQEMDVEGLDAEMAANEAETKMVVEVVEKYREDARRSKVWGTVIVVLVAGIFATGIVSAVRSNKTDAEGGNDENNPGRRLTEDGKKDRNSRKKRNFETRKKRELEIEDLD